MLPKRRDPVRSGISRSVKREWPRHRSWVRLHNCCVPGCERGPIEFAHVRSSMSAGTGQKPPDWFGVSFCSHHHIQQHTWGEKAFEKEYGINLLDLAAEFSAKSPDNRMKLEMRNV